MNIETSLKSMLFSYIELCIIYLNVPVNIIDANPQESEKISLRHTRLWDTMSFIMN